MGPARGSGRALAHAPRGCRVPRRLTRVTRGSAARDSIRRPTAVGKVELGKVQTLVHSVVLIAHLKLANTASSILTKKFGSMPKTRGTRALQCRVPRCLSRVTRHGTGESVELSPWSFRALRGTTRVLPSLSTAAREGQLGSREVHEGVARVEPGFRGGPRTSHSAGWAGRERLGIRSSRKNAAVVDSSVGMLQASMKSSMVLSPCHRDALRQV